MINSKFILENKMVTLTGIKDVDLKILSILDDTDLMSICSLNKYLYNISNINYFWRDR